MSDALFESCPGAVPHASPRPGATAEATDRETAARPLAQRRWPASRSRWLPGAAWGPLLVAMLVAGCAGTSPPVQLYRLPLQPPVALSAVSVPGGAVLPFVLLSPVALPDYLDRDALVAPTGAAGLQVLAGQRWAEPLRESVPRLLRLDLAALLGEAAVQSGPLAAGTGPGRALAVELLAFEPAVDRRAVTLTARWQWRARAGATATVEPALPLTGSARLTAPVVGSGTEAVVLAHRAALAQLAAEIGRSLPAAP
jgi:uncharacterized protein